MKKSDFEKIVKECVLEVINESRNPDPTKEEMIQSIPSIYRSEDGFLDSFEVAAYWFANDYHGGQNSNLYSILSTSPYSPSRINRGGIEGEDDTLAKDIYSELVSIYFPGTQKEEGPVDEAKNSLGETEYRTYSSWLRAVKQLDPQARIEGDKDIASAFASDGKPLGQWEGDVGSIHQRDDIIAIKPKNGKPFKTTWTSFKQQNADGFSPEEFEQFEKELNEKGQFTVGGGAAQEFTIVKKKNVVKEEDQTEKKPNEQEKQTPENELKRTQTDFEGGKLVRGLKYQPINVKAKAVLKNKVGEEILKPGETFQIFFSTNPRFIYIFAVGKWWSLPVASAHKYLTKFKPQPGLNSLDGSVISTPIGNKVEPDGIGPNGDPSWLLVLGLI